MQVASFSARQNPAPNAESENLGGSEQLSPNAFN
jgi:hypothetical protein